MTGRYYISYFSQNDEVLSHHHQRSCDPAVFSELHPTSSVKRCRLPRDIHESFPRGAAGDGLSVLVAPGIATGMDVYLWAIVGTQQTSAAFVYDGTATEHQPYSAVEFTRGANANSGTYYAPSSGAVSLEQSAELTADEGALSDGDLENNLYSLSADGAITAAIKLLYGRFNEILHSGDFQKCDRVLSMIDLNRLRPELWVALLTITLPARSKLPSRRLQVNQIRDKLSQVGEDADAILVGLE
jgi:hypothetical protein